jgi:hypothetical protein
MIEHTLNEVRNMRDGNDGKGFYEEDGDHEHIGDDVDSISGDMSADEQMDAADAPAPAAANKPIANGMPIKTPSLSNGVGAGNDKQFAKLQEQMQDLKNSQAMFMSLIGNKAASLALTNPGVKRCTLKTHFEGSLSAISSGVTQARFKPEFKDLQKSLGVGANITKVMIIGYDLSASPVSLGVIAPSHMSHANHEHLTVSGNVMFEAKRLKEVTFDVPLTAYVGSDYSIGKDILTRYPDVNVDNVGANVKDSPIKGMVLVAASDVVAAAICDELEKMKLDAEKAGKAYTGPTYEGLFKADFNALHVDKAIATRAMNTLVATLMTSNKSFNANTDLYFDFVRTCVTPDSADKAKSSSTSLWTDKRELSTFLKGGATIDSMVSSVFSASLMIAVEYTLPEKK